MVHKYPFTVLHIEIKPELLDVNVHPAKMEVRMKREEEVYSFIYTTLREALNRREMIPDISLGGKRKEKISQHEKIEPFEVRRGGYGSPYIKPKMLRESDNFFEKPRSMTKSEQKEKIKQELKTLEEILKPRERESQKEQLEKTDITLKNNSIDIGNDEKTADNGTEKNIPIDMKESSIVEKRDPDDNKILKSEGEFVKEDEKNFKQQVGLEEREEYQNNLSKERNKIEENNKKKPEQLSFFTEEEKQGQKKKYKIIGSVFDTYWLLEGEDKLFMLDQHAAHEKVMFEKLMEQKREQKIYEQQLNPPIVVSLTINEQEMIQKYEEQFKALGFTIEEFGSNEYCIRTVPANLYGLGEREVLMEMIDQLCEDGILLEPDKIFYKIATMACKAAVKGNQRLSLPEAQALVEQLMRLENPYTCPHGRPVFISMSKTEIEKMFKRIQS